jgi:hypothetical protein
MSRMVEDERQHDDGIEARRRTIIRENWYRDVWLFVITVFMVAAVLFGIGENEERIQDVQESRYIFQLQNCQSVNARNLSAKAKARRIVSAQGQRTVTTLIDEMLPFHRDCEARAREGVEIPPD